MDTFEEIRVNKEAGERLLAKEASPEQKKEALYLLDKCNAYLKFFKNQKLDENEIKFLNDKDKASHIVCFYFKGEGFSSLTVAQKLSEVAKKEYTPIEVYDWLVELFGPPAEER